MKREDAANRDALLETFTFRVRPAGPAAPGGWKKSYPVGRNLTTPQAPGRGAIPRHPGFSTVRRRRANQPS
jgi:hypothetical protein